MLPPELSFQLLEVYWNHSTYSQVEEFQKYVPVEKYLTRNLIPFEYNKVQDADKLRKFLYDVHGPVYRIKETFGHLHGFTVRGNSVHGKPEGRIEIELRGPPYEGHYHRYKLDYFDGQIQEAEQSLIHGPGSTQLIIYQYEQGKLVEKRPQIVIGDASYESGTVQYYRPSRALDSYPEDVVSVKEEEYFRTIYRRPNIIEFINKTTGQVRIQERDDFDPEVKNLR
ncbi:MAG: hypothetical protein ACYCQJ_14860 [Nitrososphaerales archaeon]